MISIPQYRWSWYLNNSDALMQQLIRWERVSSFSNILIFTKQVLSALNCRGLLPGYLRGNFSTISSRFYQPATSIITKCTRLPIILIACNVSTSISVTSPKYYSVVLLGFSFFSSCVVKLHSFRITKEPPDSMHHRPNACRWRVRLAHQLKTIWFSLSFHLIFSHAEIGVMPAALEWVVGMEDSLACCSD